MKFSHWLSKLVTLGFRGGVRVQRCNIGTLKNRIVFFFGGGVNYTTIIRRNPQNSGDNYYKAPILGFKVEFRGPQGSLHLLRLGAQFLGIHVPLNPKPYRDSMYFLSKAPI